MAQDSIVRMANQIARNLAHGHGDPARALADHINAFWDPRMRGQLLAELDTANADLSETVRSARPYLKAPATQD